MYLPRMKTYIVKLENHDDVISTRDKISWSQARRVLLVWPRHGRVLDRQLDLRLVQRHCQQLGAQMAIVTGDGEVKSHAAELGIPVFRDSIQAQQSAWRRLPGSQARLKAGPVQPGLRVSAHDLREQRKLHHSEEIENKWLRYSAFGLGFLAFLALVFFFVPGARVAVTPVRKSQQITLPVSLQPGITTANASGAIPVHPIIVIVEGRDQTIATGRVTVPDKIAKGEVMLTNLNEQAVDLPRGSVVLSMGTQPWRYKTTQNVTVPAGVGSTRLVSVQAVYPGSSGNAPAGRVQALEGPLGLKVSVTNPQAITGGSDRTSPAPASQDYLKLKQKMLADLQNIGLDEMRAKILAGQRLVEESIQMQSILVEEREPKEDQPADQLQLTLQVEFRAWFIEESDLQVVAQSALDANLPSGYQPLSDTLILRLNINPRVENAKLTSSSNLVGRLFAERTMKAVLNENEVVESLRGRRVTEAASILKSDLNLAGQPVIEITPSWWRLMPFLPFQINLVEQ